MPHTILITGANRGLGLEMTRQLTDAGHTVIGTARKPDEARELRDTAHRVEPLDITDQASVDALAASLDNDNTPLDILINNAAVSPRPGTIDDLDLQTLHDETTIQYLGPLRVTRALLPALRRGNHKLIASITSNLGSHADAEGSGGFYAYRAGKSALNMLTICIAQDLKPEGFTVLAIHPGWVQTRMGGDQAPLQPEESIKGVLSVLLSATQEQSGQFIAWDGNNLPW